MSKADDILKKYGITPVAGTSSKTQSQSNTQSQSQITTGTGGSKADEILKKYGITPVAGTGSKKQSQTQSATGSAQSWISSANSYFDDASKYLGTWHKRNSNDPEYSSLMKRSSSLIAEAYNWRNQYADDEDAVSYINEVIAMLNDSRSSFNKQLSYYDQWDTEADYQKYLQYSTPEGRQEQYGKNQKRLEELKLQRNALHNQPGMNPYLYGAGVSTMPLYGAAGQNPRTRATEIEKEIDALQKEMRLYEYGEMDEAGNYYGYKTADDYGQYLKDDRFVDAAKYRGYKNASRADMDAYDAAQSNISTALSNGGYADDEGNVYNAKGELIQRAGSEPVVEDKLGLFLSSSDEDVEEAYGILSSSNGSYDTTWADIMQEGDTKRWKYLKDDEIQIYYGLLRTKGQEAAYQYLDDMQVELGRRENQAMQEYVNASSGWSQVGLNALSVPMSMAGGVAATVDNASRLVQGKQLNPYSRAQMPTRTASYIRANTAQEIDEATGNADFLGLGFSWGDAYQAGMSMIDSLVGARVGGKAYQAVMSMGAASSEATRLYSQGANTSQIVLGSFAAGAAEWVFEKYSIENLINMKSPETLWQFIKNTLIQGGIEMSEEAATELANIIADGIIMQHESDWAKALEKHGGDYGKATTEMAIRIVNAGLGGFISGLGSGGIQQGIEYAANAKANKQTKQAYGGSQKELVAEALEIDPDNTYAQQMQKRLDKGKDLTGQQLRNLVRQNEETIAGMPNAEEAEETAEETPNTGTISPQEYRSLLKAAQLPQNGTNVQTNNVAGATMKAGEQAQAEPMATHPATVPANDQQMTGKLTGKESLQVAEEFSVAQQKPITLEEASKEYGAQAGTMMRTYNEGQDVAKFAYAYRAAYDMGRSGVPDSYLAKSESVRYLTEDQRRLAYDAGAKAAQTKAAAKDAENRAAANGFTGYKKGGVVRGEGVKIADLKKTFNDTRGRAYKSLSTIAKATGVTIVLYKSKTDVDGNFVGEQGKFDPNNPYELRIDINAGLNNISEVDDLERYVFMRTFTHEFSHFIEKWNPIRYNEFRKAVFDTLEKLGVDVNDLIELRMKKDGLDYEAASREVMADAMVDILNDSSFVQMLAEKHKSVFQKLLEKLKEFAENIHDYFNSITWDAENYAANALKENGKYLDSIVKMWDEIAVEAVENFQKTVAKEEATVAKNATTETTVEKTVAKVEETAPVVTKSDNGFTMIDHVVPSEIRETNKEVTDNGKESENGLDARAVHGPVRGSERPARLLEGVEPEAVRASDEGRQPVQSGSDQGTGNAGRDRRADAAGTVSERSTGDRVGGDLQRVSSVSEDATDNHVGDKTDEDTNVPTKEEQEAQLHETVQEEIEQKSTINPKGSNFVIGDSLNLPNGTKARVRANIEAIKLVKQIAAEDRIATAAEQEILSKYVGWGGLADAFGKPYSNMQTRKMEYQAVKGLEAEFEELKTVLTEDEYKSARESTKNAHYTSIEVIKAMYDGLQQLGFAGGRMLEPSSGVGNFVGAMPASMSAQVKSWTMVELDNITGLFAKYLYPNADVRIQGFEQTNIPDGYMDVAIGNVPFGNYAITDKHYPKAVTSAIHNYFFAKTLDKVRTGGIVMFITSSYTMNGRDNAVRKYIAQRADLLGAIRLPNTAFAGNAGTSVVTDILILKKRADKTEYAGEAFQESNWEKIGSGWDGGYVNEYFTAHPEMVLGTPKLTRGMYSSNELTYDPFTDRGTLGDQIREAMKHIQGKMEYPAQVSAEKANYRQAAAKKKAQKLQIKDGVIHSRDENGNLTKVDVDKDTAERITGMVAIRDAHIALCDAMQQGVNSQSISRLRKALNNAYDSFVEKYGYLNAPKNKKAINAFADRYAILSLENYSTEGKKVTVTKSDVFTKNTIAANRTQMSAENVEEGLTISLNTVGGVDVAMIARLTGQNADSVTRQLIDQRLAFKDKDGNLIPAAQYLSGNVRAKLREMEGLTGIDKDYLNNVEALREVVPPTVQHTDIYVNPGANWVPVQVYEDFVGHILQRSNYTSYRSGKKDFSVEYVPETNEYKVAINDAYAKQSAQNTQVWGEGGKAFSTIFENLLNGRRTNVYRDRGDGTRELDRAKTEAVAEKAEKLNEEFRKWLWEDESRRAEMQELYNETYNALVTPKYSGESLTVNGLNSTYTLREHQKDAVARIINSGGNTLLAHRVGAGKTMEMAAAAMKLKQLGVIKKPMFVVPNNVVAQWGKEFKDYFPAANILVVGDEDMTAAERMTTINRIKNNDYDAVILAYTKFEKIQMTVGWRQKFYEEQIESILFAINAEKESQGGKGFTVKQLETKRKQLENKVKKLTDKAKDEDGAMFEDLGVDSLFVDEAHNFKNLEYSTRMTNVSGLGKADGAQRSFDLYTKVRYLQQLNGGRGVVFATATPVMNSMTEMYIMQKYLQPDMLKQLGIEHFDSWAKMFGEVVNALEISPSGSGYRLKQTFSKFKNVKALQQMFRSFTDVLTDIPGLKIPKMKGRKVQIVECEQSEFQKNYMAELAERANNVKNVDPSEDNMLKITSDGRKISYSQRMIDPSLPYEETGKIYKCCENVYKVYKESSKTKGTQMIFCDMATPKGKSSTKTETDTSTDEFAAVDVESAQLYDDMKARLVQLGIPAKEIAFIHDAKNDKQKAELAEKMNNGTIRVLIGSTGKMGVGLNAQKKAVAIHHLDAPWRPGDIEQRDGRVFRQKNENDEAYKFVYVTRGSFDSRLWDILERKQKFINQVMNGDDVGNEIEDTGEVTLSAAEVKAVASDNPLIMEQVALEKEISKLQSLQQAHRANVSRAQEKIVKDRKNIALLDNLIANGQKDIQSRKDTYSSEKVFSIRIGNHTYTDKKDAGIALVAAAQANAKDGEYTDIGQFAGFALRVVKTAEGIKGIVSGAGNYEFKTYPLNPSYGVAHLISVVEGIDERMKLWNKNLREAKNDLEIQTQIAAEPFAESEKLRQKRSRYNEVMDILNPPKEEQNLDTDGGDAVQYQSRDYLYGVEYDDENANRKETQNALSGLAGKQNTAGSYGTLSAAEAEKIWEEIGTEKQEQIIDQIDLYTYVSEEADIYLFDGMDADLMDQSERTKILEETAKQFLAGMHGDRTLLELDERFGWLGNNRALLIRDVEAIEAGTFEMDDEWEQYQQRTHSLTDREVLEMARDELDLADLEAGERGALDILKKRLDNLKKLQEERKTLGELYRQQQFGTKVDRAEAEKTLNRMKVLDGQIKRAKAEVLDVENKEVLASVLQRARKIVEKQQWTKDQESLKRWRDRRNNADAIKKYRTRLKKDVDELTSWVLHPNNKDIVKHIPEVLKKSVIPFLSSVDFTSKRQLRGGEATKADNEFMKRLQGLQAALDQKQNPEEAYADYTDLPPDFMEKLGALIKTAEQLTKNTNGEFVVNQMTSAELKALSEVVRNLKAFIQNFNRFHYNAMFRHVSEAGDNSVEFMGQMKPAEYTGGISKFVLWDQMRPAYAFERFGEGGVAIYDGLRRGQATMAFNTKKITDFAEKAYTPAEVQAWEKEIKTIELEGSIVKMPVSTIMSFYELSKRPQALGHILGAGVRVATFKANGKKIADGGHKLTIEDVNTIIDQLTDRQKEVADNLQKFMQEQGGKWGNYVSMKRFGEKLFGEEHYFPINSDGRYLQANADEKPANASLYALLNMGFTKATTENASNQIVLYSIFDVFSSHMASMAQYNAFALPVVDAIKWFNYQQKGEPDENGKREVVASVRDLMDRTYGTPEESRPGSGKSGYAQNFVINIIKAFNGTEAQGTPYDTVGLQLLNHYNRAQVAYNFRVVVQQPMAITRAAQLIDYGSIIRGLKLNPAAIKKNIDEMQEHSGIAAWKALGFYDVNISRGLTSIIKHDQTWQENVIEFGMKGAEIADTVTWAAIWSACKEEVMRKQKLKPKDAGFYDAVTKLFEDVIYKTQVVDSVLTKNEFMRDKGFLARSVGSFMSEPTTTASMLIDAFDKLNMDMQRGQSLQQAWKKNRNTIVRTVYVYSVSAILLAAVQAVVDAWRDDDEYQTGAEKWLEAFAGNLLDELMPFNKLPIFSEFYEFVKELVAVGGLDIYGQMKNFVWTDVAEQFIKGIEIICGKIKGTEDRYTWYGGAYKLLQAASGILGLPMANATREIAGAWNNTVGAMAPSLKIKSYDAGDWSEIKYAYLDGHLTEDEATDLLIEKKLVSSEDQAYFAIREWEAGEGYSRYNAIYDAVRNNGNFSAAMGELTSHGYSEKEVLSEVKEQIGKWYKEGKITKQQATSMLSKYFDMGSEEVTAIVNRWSSKVVTGIAFDDIKYEYMEGNITASRAIDMYTRYGGYTRKSAMETVSKWKFEQDYGFAYDDRVYAYKKGLVNAATLRKAMIEFGGLTETEADDNLLAYEWMKKNPQYDIDVTGAKRFAVRISDKRKDYTLSDYNVSVETYLEYVRRAKDCPGVDEDGDGYIDDYSKAIQLFDMIDTLPISPDQKDALAYITNAKGTIEKYAPWHK